MLHKHCISRREEKKEEFSPRAPLSRSQVMDSIAAAAHLAPQQNHNKELRYRKGTFFPAISKW
jgi:hypothetical protein